MSAVCSSWFPTRDSD